MRRGDIRVLSGAYGVREFDAEDRDTSGQKQILSGEPVIGRVGTGSNFVRPIPNGRPLATSNDIFVGIARDDSDETATADGKVDVDIVGPGTILEGDASTAANIDTAAELTGLMFDFVAFDVSATSVYTIDEDENGSATNLYLCIIGGDVVRTRVVVMVTKNSLASSLLRQP